MTFQEIQVLLLNVCAAEHPHLLKFLLSLISLYFSPVNFFADPYAVKELLTDGTVPLERFLLLPLDITTPHELCFPNYAEVVDQSFAPGTKSLPERKSPLVHFTSAFLERTREVMREFGKDAMEYVSSFTFLSLCFRSCLLSDDRSHFLLVLFIKTA